MIQDSKEGKFLPMFNHAITVACSSPDCPVKFVKADDPITVKLNSSKEEITLTDGHSYVPCLFTKDAVFWYRMTGPKKTIKELDGKLIALKEYEPYSVLKDGDVELYLLVHSFELLEGEDAKVSKGKELVKEITKQLDILKKAHLRMETKLPDLDKLPDLEALLSGKDISYKAVIPPVKKGKKKEEEKKDKKEKKVKGDKVAIKFKDLDKVEKEIAEKVECILKAEEKAKKTTIAGSEGDVERKGAIEKAATHVDDYFKGLLQKKGLLYKKRTPNKNSPAKKRSPPKDIKKAIEIMKEDVKAVAEKVASKRPKAEGAEKKKEKPAKKAKKEGKKKA